MERQILFKCPWCEFTASNLRVDLRKHAVSTHNVTLVELSDAVRNPPTPAPACGCGCGEPTQPDKRGGHNEFIRGHSSRVKNNWGNNKAARERSLETRRREGLWSRNPWNRGKTKENDSEYAAICERAYNSEKEKDRRSTFMSKQWQTGIIVPLTGSAHPNWKGGTSTISTLCHGSSRLYKLWKFPALQLAGFRCERCGSVDDLHVHHSATRMAEIIHQCAPTSDEISWEEQAAWVERVIDWHVEHAPPAEVLCHRCHGDEHPSLNFDP
jgi:hypothetical protein